VVGVVEAVDVVFAVGVSVVVGVAVPVGRFVGRTLTAEPLGWFGRDPDDRSSVATGWVSAPGLVHVLR
jgi:hypothetical protein